MQHLVPDGFVQVTGQGPFSGHIGPTWVRDEDGGDSTYGVLIAEKHLNKRGVVHGGMLMSFMDHLLGRTIHHAIGGATTATIQLDNQFLSGVREGVWMQGKGDIVRQTRSLVFVTGRLWVDETPVLQSSGVWKILGA